MKFGCRNSVKRSIQTNRKKDEKQQQTVNYQRNQIQSKMCFTLKSKIWHKKIILYDLFEMRERENERESAREKENEIQKA